ncbi:MAG: VWA domain-containing protein [Opitutaceae bacterium]|nr:VWA domain-containing protein [Opitutaceae bacterium]
MKSIRSLIIAATGLLLGSLATSAAGTLTPVGATQSPIQIRDHHVDIIINNGFARTEVTQTFFNPNAKDLEAVYAFPVPKSASLSEMTIWAGEKEIHGEVLAKQQATQIYEEEKAAGNDTGLATKNSYQTFEFRVSPVRSNAETRVRFVYYQPLEIDTGIGRYLYPLEDGGTDDAGASFWTQNKSIEGTLSISLELKSAAPIADVRVPGFETAAAVEKLTDGHYRVKLDRTAAKIDRDFLFYYRLQDGLPGRIEVIPYRAATDKPGTFMMVVTPGVDLAPLTNGADYVYVLDVSGSMQGKIATLARGVARALGEMKPKDRFRIVTFNDAAREVVPWTAASPEAVQRALATVQGLASSGSTNLYDGLQLALQQTDADRATSLVLVTDGVTNTGVVDPKEFAKLLRQKDIRVFGFLMGNNANWPLLRVAAEASGGFYTGVSNDDDILGQILLAKSKICFEAMHDASLKITGVRVTESTGDYPGKLYRGQQLVVFGRYEKAGPAKVELHARITGEDKTYTTTFDFPETDTANPEIERLWALSLVEQIETGRDRGDIVAAEADAAIRDLGTSYQIVNDQTAMVVLDDATFAKRGIDRRNQQRVATERQAQTVRAAQPARDARVDTAQPAFQRPAHSVGGSSGGGALDRGSVIALLITLLTAFALVRVAERKRREREQR